MNRQLYADGGVKSLMDLLEPETREMVEASRSEIPDVYPEEEKIMEMLRRRYENDPNYQYDETRPYEGPRDMRMSGGILSAPIINNRVNAFGGFGGFVSSIAGGIGDLVGGAADAVGDVVGGVGDVVGGIGDVVGDLDSGDLDTFAQIASFIPGPHQPFAQAYTTGSSSGMFGNDYGGFQIGGFTPSGGSFGTTSTSGPFSGGGTFGTPGTGDDGMFGFPQSSGSDFGKITNILKMTQDPRKGGGNLPGQGGKQPSSTAGILGTILNTAISAYGAKKSYDEQKKENQLKQQMYQEEERRYDEFLARQERKRRQYSGLEALEGMDVRNRQRTKEDVVGRSGLKKGGSTKMGYKEYKENEEFMKDARKKYDAYPFKKTISFDDFVRDILKKRTGMAAGGVIKGLRGLSKLGRKADDQLENAFEEVSARADFDFSDYKMRGQLMAEELAQIRYNKDYYDLDQKTQMDLYSESDDFLKSKADDFDDYMYDMMKERDGMMRGGVMSLDVRTNPQGTKEIDYREKGGFVPPIGIKEKADDIPAMLSNNEFVFTADAVRGAGNGNVNEGAKKMYQLMNKLEGQS